MLNNSANMDDNSQLGYQLSKIATAFQLRTQRNPDLRAPPTDEIVVLRIIKKNIKKMK